MAWATCGKWLSVVCLAAVVCVTFFLVDDARAVLIQDFDDPPFTLTRHGTEPGPGVLTGGPDGDYLRLTSDIGNQGNSAAFDEVTSASGPQPGGITLEFDFRMSAEAGHTGCCDQRADGFGIGLFSIDTYGANGAGPGNEGQGGAANWERPTFPDAFTVGFDIFDSGGGPDVDGNTVSLNWAGAEIASVTFPEDQIVLNSGVFHRASVAISADGTNGRVSMTIEKNVLAGGGQVIPVFENVEVPGLDLNNLPGNRLIAGGRTGGAFVATDLDNIDLRAIPEPSSIAMTVVGAILLLGLRLKKRYRRG